jgi:hypothetical protein
VIFEGLAGVRQPASRHCALCIVVTLGMTPAQNSSRGTSVDSIPNSSVFYRAAQACYRSCDRLA